MNYGVKANIKAPHRFLRMVGLCWIVMPNTGGGGDNVFVRGMSRSGRKVNTWVNSKDLTSFRPGWINRNNVFMSFGTRHDAQAWADGMNARFGDIGIRPHAAHHGHTTP